MIDLIEKFLNDDSLPVGTIENERALQLELGLFLRQQNHAVQFEKVCKVATHGSQTKQQKRNLDLLIGEASNALSIELKVPLAGRVPETMYDFIADIAFVEAIINSGIATRGICLMVTDDPLFWSGKAQGIYRAFRSEGSLKGLYQKPTGKNPSQVHLNNDYNLCWKPLKNTGLMKCAKYLILASR